MYKTIILFIFLMASIAQAADQAVNYNGADATAKANCEVLNKSIQESKQARINALIPTPASQAFSTGTCLDNILNTRVNIFTLPSLDGLLNGIMDQVKNAACNAVMNKWNRAVGNVNQTLGTTVNAPYIGQVGGVNVGQGTGNSPVNVNNGQGLPTYNGTISNATTISEENTNVLNKIFQ